MPVPKASGPTSADEAGNAWLPEVKLNWPYPMPGKEKHAVTDAKHQMVSIRKPGQGGGP